jgi:hypothetical protein
MTPEARTVEELADGSLRVTDVDVMTGARVSYIIPERAVHLTSTDTDANLLLAIRDEFRALVEDVTAPDRTERLLALREQFLTLRDAVKIADAEAPTDEGEAP